MSEHVRLSSHASVLLIEMVQEDNRNAMTAEMKLALSEALDRAARAGGALCRHHRIWQGLLCRR